MPAGRSEGCCDDDEESEKSSLCSASPDSVASPHDPTAAGSQSASVLLTHSVKEDKKDESSHLSCTEFLFRQN